MRRITLFLLPVLLALFCSCSIAYEKSDIAATTLPVYQFTAELCKGTGLSVTRLVTENVSCLHDYSLNVRQARAVEGAALVVCSGAGLEAFMEDLLSGKQLIDASAGIPLLESCHAHEHGHDEAHHHETDPHIWLSPENAMRMAQNICSGLTAEYPAFEETFDQNLQELTQRLQILDAYGKAQLSQLQSRELITFHDGFSYLAQAFDLTVLKAVEEESGSEASAAELRELTLLVQSHGLSAIFTEANGADSAARIISRETGAKIYMLDMAMAGEDYFSAMYHNIDTIKEALG